MSDKVPFVDWSVISGRFGFVFFAAPTRTIREITRNRTNKTISASCVFVDRLP
jgi:hypothetical protein